MRVFIYFYFAETRKAFYKFFIETFFLSTQDFQMLREIQQKMMNAKVSIIWITYKIMICL